MSLRKCLTIVSFLALCLFGLFFFAPAQDQPVAEKVIVLNEAQTLADVNAYIQQELSAGGIDGALDAKARETLIGKVLMPAGEKMLEIAKKSGETSDTRNAYSMIFAALQCQISTGVEGAEEKMDAFLQKIRNGSLPEDQLIFNQFRLRRLRSKIFAAEPSPENFNTFKSEWKNALNGVCPDHVAPPRADLYLVRSITRVGLLGAQFHNVPLESFVDDLIAFVQSPEYTYPEAVKEEITATIKSTLSTFQFQEFAEKTLDTVTPETFDDFKTELKTWIDRKVPLSEAASFGLAVAEKNNVPAEALINELLAYVQSPQCTALTAEEKKESAEILEGLLRLMAGQDPKLYGRTLDDKEFDWNALRGKYVLIKFTATWCGPCKGEIPGMLEAYRMYRDKGLEIVSVYVWENDPDPVAAVKKMVEEEKLPWIILSEELTAKSQQVKQSEFYGISGVPTMVLTDKEGKIIMTEARGEGLQRKLAEIFK